MLTLRLGWLSCSWQFRRLPFTPSLPESELYVSPHQLLKVKKINSDI